MITVEYTSSMSGKEPIFGFDYQVSSIIFTINNIFPSSQL